VYLVDEERRAAAAPLLLARLRDGRAHLLDAREDRRERHEARPRAAREQPRQRRLARAGAAPEDERRQQPAALYHAPQHAPLADEVALPDELFEVARPHLLGQRGARVRRRLGNFRLVAEETFTHAARHGSPSSFGKFCTGELGNCPELSTKGRGGVRRRRRQKCEARICRKV
jgi:hypothetical protein